MPPCGNKGHCKQLQTYVTASCIVSANSSVASHQRGLLQYSNRVCAVASLNIENDRNGIKLAFVRGSLNSISLRTTMSQKRDTNCYPDGYYRVLNTSELRELLQDEEKMDQIVRLNEKVDFFAINTIILNHITFSLSITLRNLLYSSRNWVKMEMWRDIRFTNIFAECMLPILPICCLTVASLYTGYTFYSMTYSLIRREAKKSKWLCVESFSFSCRLSLCFLLRFMWNMIYADKFTTFRSLAAWLQTLRYVRS